MGVWDGAASAGIGAGVGMLSMIGQKKREERSLNNQKDLMNMQYQNQRGLNEQGFGLQKKMWEETNYPAQMGMLKEAGLNPALMYGMSGGGGTTTGSQGGGSASSGNAPQPQHMDIGNMIQGALAASQIKVNEAKAEELKANASSTRGEAGTVGGSEIERNTASALNSRNQAAWTGLETEINRLIKDDRVDEAHYKVEGMIKQNQLVDDQANLVREKAATEILNRVLINAQVGLVKGQTNKLGHDIIATYKMAQAALGQAANSAQANTLRGIEGKADLNKQAIDFVKFSLQNKLDWAKLTQKQWSDIMSALSILGIGGAIKSAATPGATTVKGFGG